VLNASDTSVTILLGQSDGSFAAGPTKSLPASPVSAAMADFDGDGFSDLAIAGNSSAYVLPGNGDGTFGSAVTAASNIFPSDLAAADFNSDGKVDLIITNQGGIFGSDSTLALNSTTHIWSATYPKVGTASTSSIQLLAKLLVDGTVYAVCVSPPIFGSTDPTSEQVRNGRDFFGNLLSDNLKGSVSVTADNQVAISCSGLTLATVYDMYVVAEVTSPPYLQPAPIKISSATAPEAPILDSVTSVSARGFIANWFGVQSATSYQIDVSPNADFSTFAPNLNGLDVGLANSVAVTGLTPGTTYHVRVRAVFSGSASAPSNSMNLTTLTVPGTPTLGATSEITPFSFKVTWGAVANVTGYYLDVATDAGFTDFTPNFNNLQLGLTNSFTVHVFSPGGSYYYRVRAANNNGSSDSSAAAAVTLPPTAPFAGSIATASTSGFTAIWGESLGASGYRLDVATDPEFTMYLSGYMNRDVGNVRSFPVTGTTPGVTYYYRVTAYNSGPNISISHTESVAIPVVPPIELNAPLAYLTGGSPVSSASADFNNDGFADVAIVNSNSNVTILLGLGSGLFREGAPFASGGTPTRIATADFNKDNNVDLIFLISGSLSVFLGNGDGTFTTPIPAYTGSNLSDFIAADFDKDGTLDLLASSLLSQLLYTLKGNGDGTFAQPLSTEASHSPIKLVAADFNGDGNLDLASTNWVATYSIFLGNGNGTFNPAVHYSTTWRPWHISAGDLNKDGSIDLVMTMSDPNSGTSTVLLQTGTGDGTFTAQPALPCGALPQALALVDLDSDTNLDIVAATNSGNQLELFYGAGNGTFATASTMATPQAVSSIIVTDLNNDSYRDIALTSSTSGLFTVFQQTATKRTFKAAPANYFAGSGTPRSLATGDFDKDGMTDLAAAIHNSAAVISLKGDGNGHLSAKIDISLGSHTPTGILVADLNKDGASDIVTTGDSSANISVVINNGNGTFQTALPYAAFGAQYRSTTGDFNGDGTPDLAVANPFSGALSILLGNGSGTFGLQSIVPAGTAPYDVVSGDFNSDGNLDLAVSNNDQAAPLLYILSGNGDGSFAAPVPYPVNARSDFLVSGDLNQDGRLDLIASNPTAGIISVLLGNGNGSFGAITEYPVGANPYELVLTDLNNDGIIDVVTANGAGTISVLPGAGDGTLLPATLYWTGNTESIAAGAFSSSGKPDLAVGDAARGGVMLLLNTTVPSLEPGYPRISITGETTAQVLLKSTIKATAYAVCLPAGSAGLSSYQIRNGLDASFSPIADGMKGTVSVTAHNQAAITFSTLQKGVAYDVYVVLEDSTQPAALQPVPGFVTFTQPPSLSYTLTVTVSGGGSVTGSSTTPGDSGSINCSAGTCSALFPAAHTVNLAAATAWYASINWANVTNSSGGTATVLMDTAKDITVSFNAAQNVQASNPFGYHGSIKTALDTAADSATIKARAMPFPDVFTLNRPGMSFTLLGGFSQLSNNAPNGVSTIPAPFTITGGRLNIGGTVKITP